MSDTESTTTAEDTESAMTAGCCGTAAPAAETAAESDSAAPEPAASETHTPAQMFGRCC